MRKLLDTFPKQHKMILAGASAFLLLALLIPADPAVASRSSTIVIADYANVDVGKAYPLPLQLPKATVEQDDTTVSKRVKIKSGDTLASLFKNQKLSQKTMLAVSRSGALAKEFTKLVPGKHLTFEFDSNDEFVGLEYQTDKTTTIVARKTDDGYTTEKELKETVKTTRYFEGTIKSNFWNAGVDAGLDDTLIMNLANVFAWDVDFALDIRKGDQFFALVEQVYVDGEFIGYGEILAAEFVNQDDRFEAVQYTDGRYYTPSGDSMRKAFLRAPVNFKYISSSFNPRRFHPVQKRYKAHRGVDYAASTGTPVVAAGDGKVIKSGYDKYNGHHVFIEHGGGITTKYIHFSKRRVKKGQRVKQGQLIGHVGATGLAAGPHLHYEFLVNGVHRNPRTVSLPKANPISKKEKDAYLAFAKQRLQQLDHNKQLLIAMR